MCCYVKYSVKTACFFGCYVNQYALVYNHSRSFESRQEHIGVKMEKQEKYKNTKEIKENCIFTADILY